MFIAGNTSIIICIYFALNESIPAGIGIIDNTGSVAATGVLTILKSILTGLLNASLALLLHEAGHLIASGLLGCGLSEFKLKPFGFSARISTKKILKWNGLRSAAVTSSGALFNLFIFALVWYGGILKTFEIFALANFFMALFNLLPALPLDGGWLVLYMIEKLTNNKTKAYRIMYVITLFTGSVIIIIGFVQLIKSHGNFSLLLAGSYIVYTAVKEYPQIKIMNKAKLLMRNLKTGSKGTNIINRETRISVAGLSSRPSEVVSYLDPGAFNLVCVVDNNMKPVGFLSENQLTNAAVSGIESQTLKDILSVAGINMV